MQLEKTNALLRVLVRLTFDNVEKYQKDIDKIELLDKLRLSTSEIAEIIGTTPLTVSVAKNKIKRRQQHSGEEKTETSPLTPV